MSFHLHIGVLVFPFGTHAAPLLALVRRLAASAPGLRFSFFNSSSSNSAIFKARVSETCDNIKAYDVWDGTPEGFSGSHFEAVGLFLKASPGNFEKAIEVAEGEIGLTVSCLISDAFLFFACDLAGTRGVPWVPFWTSGSCSLAAHIYTDAIKDAETTEKTVSFIPGLSKVNFTDLPPEIFLDKNPSPLAQTIYNMVKNITKSTALVLNSFEEIDPIITKDLKSKFNHFLNFGPSLPTSPPNPNDKTGCLSWLDNQPRGKSVIYISFGSVASLPGNEIVALAEALETLKHPFIWSMKDEAKKTLPKGFLERTKDIGKIVPWAPQPLVLAHASVGLFVTHCGWNSVLESIYSGVPMICRPFFGDQKLNGRMVESVWRIGVEVKGGGFSKSETIEAMKHVMLSEEGKAIRENVGVLKEKAENAVKLEGSSSKNFKTLLEIIGATKLN